MYMSFSYFQSILFFLWVTKIDIGWSIICFLKNKFYGGIVIETFYTVQLNSIDNELREIDKYLKQMPEGELKAYNNNGSSRWFYINGDKRVYLSRSNKDIAKKLAMKKYYLLKKQLLLERNIK